MSQFQLVAISIGLSLVILLLLGLFPPRWLFAIVANIFPGAIYVATTSTKAIALTIDDGPNPATTELILDTLARHQATATFFIIADRVPGNERILARILANGHEIGNHTTADLPSIKLTIGDFERDLIAADTILTEFIKPRWFRPASGWYSAAMIKIAHKYNYQVALGSIFPYDTNISAPWFATQFILVNARAGGIIVLHDAHWGRNTAITLDRVLPQLQQRGYQIVTLSQLVDRQ